jgi:hypothetical protein
VAAPFRQPMAEDKAVVAESKQVLEEIGVAQNPFKPRGTL